MTSIPKKWAGRIMRWVFALGLALIVTVGLAAIWQWVISEHHTVQSNALNEKRDYRVFNPDSRGPIVYAFDGQSLRHGLAPAVLFSLGALARAQPMPKLVAISSGKQRDRDFRPIESEPSSWRQVISGRSHKFDRFLLDELAPRVEGHQPLSGKRYLMGHSLAGLYALELAVREQNQFDGVFAFSPTFSHDLSVKERLGDLCAPDLDVFVNWGLESARDDEVYQATMTHWLDVPKCGAHPPATARHYGAIHQIVMLSGQAHAALAFQL